jgi:hypothetical protein
MPLEEEQPQAVVPGYQYVAAPDGQVMLVPLPAPATEGTSPLPCRLLTRLRNSFVDTDSWWTPWVRLLS